MDQNHGALDSELTCPHCGRIVTPWQAPPLTPGERRVMWIADKVATWRFAFVLLVAIAGWVVLNVAGRPFGPYPVIVFAVISAVLGSIAALQGPLILSAQHRASERDRLRDIETLRAVGRNEASLDRIEAGLAELRRRGDE